MPHKDKDSYREYMNDYMKERWKKRRAKAVEFLGGKCKLCDKKDELQFDHIDYRTKIYSIARASSFSEERFWAEVKKCQLLCPEHHILKTQIAGDPRGGGWKRVPYIEYDHGSGHMYNKDKCRCDDCRGWKRKYRAKEVNYMGLPRS